MMKVILAVPLVGLLLFAPVASAKDIVHDAEYYILDAQNGEKWTAEDTTLDQRLAELREKHGQPPNLIHIMWDDTAYGDIGIVAIQKIRGLETPSLNKMADEGILFTRMYTEVGCTPSRAAVATGRLAVRSGMYNIGMLLESHGMRDEEVTMAEVLSKAGYATAFHGKWHLDDIEESYPHNQGFDEAFFTGYNQILSLNTRIAEGANASIGLYEVLRTSSETDHRRRLRYCEWLSHVRGIDTDGPPLVRRLHLPRFRGVLLQRQMRPATVIVGEITAKNPEQIAEFLQSHQDPSRGPSVSPAMATG